MADPFTLAGLLGAAFDWSIGRIGEVGLNSLKDRLANRAAKGELADIAARSVDEAALAAPGLAEMLCSEAYINNVLAPGILDVLRDPGTGLSATKLAQRFIDRFVAPYVRRGDVDETIRTACRTEPAQVTAAFERLVEAFRRELLGSKHWREPIALIGAEATRLGVIAANQKLDALLPSPKSLEAMRADAKAGSSQLREWPTRIRGLYLDRPELTDLIHRVRTMPGGATLVVGPSGSGKSAIFADLTQGLEAAGMTVFAIKADKLSETVRTFADVSRDLGMTGEIDKEIEALATREPVVVIIDQLDAVSEVMDRGSERMNLLLRLVNRWRSDDQVSAGAVHVVVSSRPFEAQHDARFRSLKADEVTLNLPHYEKVEALLQDLGIGPDRVPTTLKETLRRPFMLKLFVDIALRNQPTEGLVEGELLTAWLSSAQLGTRDERREVLALLQDLANEMTETETLWRPADIYALDHAEALRRAEACELIVRKDGKIGFSHQAWLDDFQAKRFKTGEQLAQHAWDGQDSLFGRAAVLRGLERFRALEPDAYGRALDLLLGEARTRRHLRHLAVGFLSGQRTPIAQEVRWGQRLIQQDPVLARIALSRVVDRWPGWRDALVTYIPQLAGDEKTKWSAIAMVTAEARIDPTVGEQLIQRLWPLPEHDVIVFDIFHRAAMWSHGVKSRVREALTRGAMRDPIVAHYISELTEAGKAEAAIELLVMHLELQGAKLKLPAHFHGLEKTVAAAPVAFAAAMFPWFVAFAADGLGDRGGLREAFAYSSRLSWHWRDRAGDHGELFPCLQKAMNQCAADAPDAFRAIVAPFRDREVDEVQGLIAEGYAAGIEHFANEAADWILADPRRLHMGAAHGEDENSVGQMVYDWSTRVLLAALAPVADRERMERIRDMIEGWTNYKAEILEEATAADRRKWRKWADDDRTPLLNLLPPDLLTPRRRRQVTEGMKTQPKLKVSGALRMAGFVGSPMSDRQMSKASDDEIFRMIDEIHDHSGGTLERRSRGLTGGVSQLSSAFGAFAKAEPARAMALARARFLPGRHEHCAGAMLRELRELEAAPVEEMLDLIRSMDAEGFASPDWRRDAAWALQTLAQRHHGLDDPDIQMLRRWLVNDPEIVAQRIVARKNLEQINRERNAGKAEQPLQAMLFGRGLHGGDQFPGDNYQALEAIALGLLLRDTPDRFAWLEFLEAYQHLPEDPAVWATILNHCAWGLWQTDDARVGALFQALWAKFPEAFGARQSHFLWRHSRLIPPDVRLGFLLSWLGAGEPGDIQLVGEFAVAGRMVYPDDAAMAHLADRVMADGPDPARLGGVFALSACWRASDEPDFRIAAHAQLTLLARECEGDLAKAVATALDTGETLLPDDQTREMLQITTENPKLLGACLNMHFADALQELLHHPTFDRLVLEVAEAAVDILLGDTSERHQGLIDQDFVAIAIALQRSSGDQRVRAMNLYERLLDAGNYFADRAARDSATRA